MRLFAGDLFEDGAPLPLKVLSGFLKFVRDFRRRLFASRLYCA